MTAEAAIAGALPWTALGSFFAAYALIMATPGPNLLAVGCVAATRGLRGAVPMALGIAFGVAALALGLALAVPDPKTLAGLTGPEGQGIAAAILLGIAARTLRGARCGTPSPAPALATRLPLPRAAGLAALTAGFATAVSNPVTIAFFAAQFIGPLGAAGDPGHRMAVPAAILAAALAWWLGVAALLTRPRLLRLIQAHHGTVRLCSGLALGGMALTMLWPLASAAAQAAALLRP